MAHLTHACRYGTTDGLWRSTASESAGYVFPPQMFFKYTIEIQE